MTAAPHTTACRTTAAQPGAVALVQLHGPGVVETLTQLTGQTQWEHGRLRLVQFQHIDQGLAVLRRPGWAQLMPHGGLRVVNQILSQLAQMGVPQHPPAPARLYPEARCPLEALALDQLARAASPAAVDLLLDQVTQWRRFLCDENRSAQRVLAQSDVLDRLLIPPTVVVAGLPNVGKSTLTNRLLGRGVSVVADLPGTTRDWVGGLAQLTTGDPDRAVAVHWLDTPGLRTSDDPIESRAIELARPMIENAGVLIAMRSPDSDWPAADRLPRKPDLWVMSKADTADQPPAGDGSAPERALPVSGVTGVGLEALQRRVLETLDLAQLPAQPWAFCAELRRAVTDKDDAALEALLA